MKLAIFDVDGTLVDSKAMIAASMAAAFAQVQLPAPPRATMMSVVGLSLVDAMQALAPDAGAAGHQQLAAAYKQAFWNFRSAGSHPERLFDGARQLLEMLRRRDDVLLGIATGKSRRGIAHLIQAHGFEDWFATIQTSDDHPSKPHPSMVQQALAETGCAAAGTIMIGDTSYDMDMARAAGVGAVAVTWGNHGTADLQLSAHVIVNDFSELHRALEGLWQERAE